MRNLIESFKADRATYYRLDQSGNRIRERVWPKYIVLIFISIFGAFAFSKIHDDAVNASIASMSIVLGFSFSVLVFFATQDPLKIKNEVARERRIAKERANRLADELFDNLTYFVYMSLSFVVISCMLLFLQSEESIVLRMLSAANEMGFGVDNKFISLINLTDFSTLFFVKFVVISLACESVYTFFRIIRRLVFYFEERRKFNACA